MNEIESVWEEMKRELAKDVTTTETRLLEKIIEVEIVIRKYNRDNDTDREF